MTPWHAAAIAVAGLGAGTINAVVGSGTLITFPTLIALGYPTGVANVSNNIGLLPGSISGALGYRAELAGQLRRTAGLSAVGFAGGLAGSGLFLLAPGAFGAVVPALIIAACLLVLLQPWLRRLAARGGGTERVSAPLVAGVLAGSVYGGYFGAAQGVIYLGLLGVFLRDSLQRLNGLKNVIGGFVNGAATVLFVVFAEPDWAVVGLIAAGSVVGGQLGALVGRRLPDVALRVVIVAVGSVAVWRLLG